MSDNEYIDLNDFEEDTYFHRYFDSLDNDDYEHVQKIERVSRQNASARHRIEEYLELKNLREQLYDPALSLDIQVKSSGSTYYT